MFYLSCTYYVAKSFDRRTVTIASFVGCASGLGMVAGLLGVAGTQNLLPVVARAAGIRNPPPGSFHPCMN